MQDRERCERVRKRLDALEACVAVARHGGERRWASLRPEAVRIVDSEAGALDATVVSRSYLGGTTRLGLDVEGQRINALLPAGQSLPSEGQSVRIGFKPEDLHLMDDAG